MASGGAGEGLSVAVMGATGAVGGVMLQILEERRFPIRSLKLLASARSAGKKIAFKNETHTIEETTEDSFENIDLVLSSAGGSVSRRFLPAAVEAGAVCVDNTSAYRMDDGVPLVVPEVNPQAALAHKGIVANPNCSTIQMVAALKPLHDAARVKRVVVSTYQAVSGAGTQASEEAKAQIRAALDGEEPPMLGKFVHPIAFNCIPQISHGVGSDPFGSDGYTDEETKMIQETVKIMEDPDIKVTATTVRIPALVGHSEALNVEMAEPLSAERARELLERAPGVTVIDDPSKCQYPTALDAAGKDDVFVGRIRKDASAPNCLNMWVVSDNLRKGAALNAVQIADLLFADR